MTSTDVVVVRPTSFPGSMRRRNNADRPQKTPRIIQYVNGETADNLLVLCGGKAMSAPSVVALDEQGQTWSLEPIPETSPVEEERGRLIWRRLWVPPLPSLVDEDARP